MTVPALSTAIANGEIALPVGGPATAGPLGEMPAAGEDGQHAIGVTRSITFAPVSAI